MSTSLKPYMSFKNNNSKWLYDYLGISVPQDYAPANCSRHTSEELREWCSESGLTIEREVIENAGITIIAKKTI